MKCAQLNVRALQGRTTAARTLALAAFAAAALVPMAAKAATTVTIATLNNPDMIELKKLSPAFEKANPDIQLKWVILEENVLRQRATTDITTSSGQFDVMAIGTYEAPQWGKRGWLVPMTNLPADYDLEDVVKTARDGLSYNGQLYALPFYVESSMTYYRKDLFQAAGLKMPDQPTYDQIKQFADKLTDKAKGQYGICLRGKAGWGENMAFVSTVVNTFGGRWFDENWHAQLDTPEWHKAVSFYADLLKNDGPPGASSNGFNENLTLMSVGQVRDVDRRDGRGRHALQQGAVASRRQDRLRRRADRRHAEGLALAVVVVARDPEDVEVGRTPRRSSSRGRRASNTSRWPAKDEGWASVPPGTRKSTYARPEYKQAAPFGDFVLKAIETADPNRFVAEEGAVQRRPVRRHS